MLKYVKQLTSLVAVLAILFAFTTETMAAKKSKTLKNTMKKGFVRCGVSQGLPGFSNADASALEKPGRPWDTPHLTQPFFCVFFRVLDFLAAIDSVANASRTATTATREVNCFKYLNIFLPFIYLLTNNSKFIWIELIIIELSFSSRTISFLYTKKNNI